MKRLEIHDAVMLSSWEEVDKIKLSTITRRDEDTATLDGIIVKGYEMKYNTTNENGERYAAGCVDKFINDYFVSNKLNVPMDVMHGCRFEDLVGRVLLIESNSVGFYIVGYIPRTAPRFDEIRNALKEGMLQGFSKCGYTTDYDFIYKKDGSFDYMLIKEIAICSVSLVSTPANRIGFEKVAEVQNSTAFVCRKMADVEDAKKVRTFAQKFFKNKNV